MKNESQDAIAIRVADHEKVSALLAQCEALSDRSSVSTKKFTDQICHARTLPSQIEGHIFYREVLPPIKDDDLMDEARVGHASAKKLIALGQKIAVRKAQ